MALARPGDRETILSKINHWDINSDLVANLLRAIKEQDPKPVRDTLGTWGVNTQPASVVEMLLSTIERFGLEERARGVLEEVIEASAFAKSGEEIQTILEAASRDARIVTQTEIESVR